VAVSGCYWDPEGIVSSGEYTEAPDDFDPPPRCGDSTIDEQLGETCDPSSACPASCDDEDACTVDTMNGSAEYCDVECVYAVIEECQDGDGCCPQACDATNDTDCWSPSDGDGEAGTDLGDTVATLCCAEMHGWTGG
jgi:hypothetical protein